MTILVEFKSLSKSFHKKVLVDNISFKLNKGEITTLIGHNGAGKTTLAKIILGQEKYNSGELFIKPNIRIGYVPQKLDFGFNIPMTAKGLLKSLATDGIDYDLIDLEEFIGYNKIKSKDISLISGGELQKLLLIGILMNKPDLLILDEPTQFLDTNSQQEFYRILRKLKEKLNITIFMISHDLFTVMKHTDQVVCINRRVCCIGKPTDISTNHGLKNALSEIGLYTHNHSHKY